MSSVRLGGGEGLGRLNELPAELARRWLLACCTSARWAAEVASARPFGSVDEVIARSDASVAGLARADLEEALSGHPRIGERPGTGGADGARAPAGVAAGWSRQEQAGMQAADQATIQALAAGNRAYEERFGHIYLVCATGRSGAALLALLRERLGHDPDAEWDAVRRELAMINQIRLRKLLERGETA